MEDFRRKARYVAMGHMTNAPPTITYASVVGHETVQIVLELDALNGLEVKAGDFENVYVTAPVTEKILTKLGDEFGVDADKRAIMVWALYGLKSIGAALRSHLADCMRHIGYTSCLIDNDLWMKPMTKANGESYYSYILNYVDDVLVISGEAVLILAWLDKYFNLKEVSVGPP